MNGCVWLLCAGRTPSGAIVQINVSQMTRSKRENKSFVTAIKKNKDWGFLPTSRLKTCRGHTGWTWLILGFFNVLSLSNRGQQSAGFSLTETPDSFHQRLNESVNVCATRVWHSCVSEIWQWAHITCTPDASSECHRHDWNLVEKKNVHWRGILNSKWALHQRFFCNFRGTRLAVPTPAWHFTENHKGWATATHADVTAFRSLKLCFCFLS